MLDFFQIRYTLIGFVPGFLIISYCNLFIGNAVLHDYDPEVFEPEHWEYYKVCIMLY